MNTTTINSLPETIDTRVMDRSQMTAYLHELTREQREGIIYEFARAGRAQPSEETIRLIAKAEGMGYTYDVENEQFVMEKPEEHDFLFWTRVPVVGTVDSGSGVVSWK